MGPLTRVELESLLRTRKLDGTLTSAHPLVDPVADADRTVSTGIEALDRRLGGGVPRGELSSLSGPPSSGRTSLLCGWLAAITQGGELAALVDARDTFDPESAAASGIALSRLLWVRGGPVTSAASTVSTLERQVDRALKALNLLLQAGGFGLVALDLADVAPALVRRLPWTTWFRLARVLEGSRTACVLVGAQPIARSPGGVSLLLEAGRSVSCWSGASDRARLFRGFDLRPRVASARQAVA